MAKANRRQRQRNRAAKAGVGGAAAAGISRASAYDIVAQSNRLQGRGLDTYFMLFARHPHVRTCVTLIAEAVGSEGFSIIPVSGVRKQPVGKAYSTKGMPVAFRSGFIASDDDSRAYTLPERIYAAKAAINQYGEQYVPSAVNVLKAAAKNANPRKNDPGKPAATQPNPVQTQGANTKPGDPQLPPPIPASTVEDKIVYDVPDDDADPRMAALKDFFRRAFPRTTMPAVITATAVDLAVYGLAYWRKKRVGIKVQGTLTPGVVALERLDPRRVAAKLSKDGTKVESFKISKLLPDGIGTDPLSGEIVPADDIIMFTKGGGDPIFGEPSPLEALDITIAADFAIRSHREAYFRNGAKAGTILANKDGDDEQIRKAREQFRRSKEGTENAYTTTILSGDAWELLAEGKAGNDDSDFLKGAEANRDEVFGVYRVPPGKILSQKGSLGQSGKQEDDATFQENAVLPYERAIYEKLTIELLDVEFNITDLQLVPKRMQALRIDMIEAAQGLSTIGATGNELRDLVGFPLVVSGPIAMDTPLYLNQKQSPTLETAPPGQTNGKKSDSPPQ